jgi:hypothetical protein
VSTANHSAQSVQLRLVYRIAYSTVCGSDLRCLGAWQLGSQAVAASAMFDPEWPFLSEVALHWLID